MIMNWIMITIMMNNHHCNHDILSQQRKCTFCPLQDSTEARQGGRVCVWQGLLYSSPFVCGEGQHGSLQVTRKYIVVTRRNLNETSRPITLFAMLVLSIPEMSSFRSLFPPLSFSFGFICKYIVWIGVSDKIDAPMHLRLWFVYSHNKDVYHRSNWPDIIHFSDFYLISFLTFQYMKDGK